MSTFEHMQEFKGPVVLFDGVCNFCDASVQFIIRRDPRAKFRFAALQSEFAQKALTKNQLNTEKFDSIVLLEEGKVYQKSTAALRIARRLNGLWPLLYGFIILPAFFRNVFYDIIARNRYRWFGKKDQCMIPGPEIRMRFIQDSDENS